MICFEIVTHARIICKVVYFHLGDVSLIDQHCRRLFLPLHCDMLNHLRTVYVTNTCILSHLYETLRINRYWRHSSKFIISLLVFSFMNYVASKASLQKFYYYSYSLFACITNKLITLETGNS